MGGRAVPSGRLPQSAVRGSRGCERVPVRESDGTGHGLPPAERLALADRVTRTDAGIGGEEKGGSCEETHGTANQGRVRNRGAMVGLTKSTTRGWPEGWRPAGQARTTLGV